MKIGNNLKVISLELVGALGVVIFIVVVLPELIWAFAFIQIFLIIFGVFYYRFLWRCPHCKLKNATLRVLMTHQKLCDVCSSKNITGY